MRRGRFALAAVLAAIPIAAHAAALTIAKSSVVVDDTVNAANPKALPGAAVDYSLLVTNPNGTLANATIRSVVISDTIPANTVLKTSDYGAAGKGPIEFADGSLLGTGLLSSGVALVFKGLADDSDGVEFYDGVTWTYHPASGYDPRVKAIRVTLTGTQAANSSFRLRFRVRVS